MNQYNFSLLTCPPDTTDAPANAACTRLARILGLLALSSDWWETQAAADESTTAQTKKMAFLSRFRLPDTLEVGINGTNLSDAGVLLTAIGKRSMSDAQLTQQLTNLDKVGVDAGDFVCAIVPPGADVSSGLSNEVVIPFGALNASAGAVVFGLANFTQREGGAALETPFAAACGFANFGPPSNFQTFILPVASNPQGVSPGIPGSKTPGFGGVPGLTIQQNNG